VSFVAKEFYGRLFSAIESGVGDGGAISGSSSDVATTTKLKDDGLVARMFHETVMMLGREGINWELPLVWATFTHHGA